MNADYLELASCRVATKWAPYSHPEDFGYDFREWVSPYTKSAHALGSAAIVLQDWISADALAKGVDPIVQQHGRVPTLKTNRYLDELLIRVLKLRIDQVYVTNAFPFIKPGGMSASIGIRDASKAVHAFAARELELAKPQRVLALGSLTHMALQRAGVSAVALPHPAARGLSLDDHEVRWRIALECT